MEPGQRLGPYRIVEHLGSGGMGEVYRAEDTRLERMVALKVLSGEFSADPDRITRFEREAKLVAALEHPNVVTIHSVEEVGGVRFLTMELVKGGTLAAEMRRGALSPRRTLEIAVPLAEGLAAAHAEGIVHRDLKPANVMLTHDGRVKVLDFGLAKLRADMTDSRASRMPTEAITEEGRVLGTLTYMSPEQVKGQPADERSDIFSAGVMLYEMASGIRPFRGDTHADISSSIIRDTPAAVTDLNRDIPADLGRIIGRCLEKNRRRRYQSALDLRNDLDALSREIETTGSGFRATANTHRRGWVVPLVATVGLAALSLFAWLSLPDGEDAVLSGPSMNASIRSIAVLPFESIGDEPEGDFFLEGIQDALITELSKTDLRVIGQASAIRFKDTELSLPEIAAALDVGGLVGGTVLRVGDDVRVSARLIHGATDRIVWADRYDRPLTDILVLTGELAQAIAGEVEVAVTPTQEQRLTRARSVDPAAWELHTRGLHHANRFTGQDLAEARRLFFEALAIDPEFAPAWVGLGMTYGIPASTGGSPDPELVAQAWRSVDRALELDPDLAEAHAGKGHLHLSLDWDWDSAERELALALELKPNSTIARHGYADLLTVQGRVDEAVDQARLGRQYDPLSRLTNITVVGHLVLARRYDEALAEYASARERIPELAPNSFWIAEAYWGLGRYEEAVAEYAAVWSGTEQAPLVEALTAGFAGKDPAVAARAAADSLAGAASPDDDALAVATWYARAGDPEAALDWLERAHEAHIPRLPVQLISEEFDFLRADSRYAELVERLNIPG